MTFSVSWQADACEEYIEPWSDPELRQSVVESARRIDVALSANPLDVGESRFGNRRVYFESPLTVVYEMFLTQRQVSILRVHYHSRR